MKTTKTVTEYESVAAGRILLSGQTFGDFRDELARNGYAVIKGAMPRERALACVDEMYSWLEGFELGFDRNDPSTIHKDKLPMINEKGMCTKYAVAHEDFAWKIRCEPGVIKAFETVFDTEDLIVSFDAINFGFPNRKDLPPNKPWAHQDQDPEKPGFRCLQGLVNLLPNGPNDGGLIVCPGLHLRSEEYHDALRGEDRIPAWTNEWYGFTEAGMKWIADRGYKWVKVCADPGDLIVWDSRTPHYNLSSTTNQPRFCAYTCYMPVADASQEDLKRKKKAFEDRVGTAHWPNALAVGDNEAIRDGKPDPHNRSRPLNEPVMTERLLKLTGIPYIKDE